MAIMQEVQKWTNAADERSGDTKTLLMHRPSSVGAIYMAGYIIELNLKALWKAKKKTPPLTHDLKHLWLGAGYELRDLQDGNGTRAFYFGTWSTSLRYEANFSTGFSCDQLVTAAKSLSGIIRRNIRRELGRIRT